MGNDEMRREYSARRVLPAAALAFLASFGGALAFADGAPASAQTVADYEAALLAIPVDATAKGDRETPCLPLGNYTFVSIAPEDRIGPLTLFGAVGAMGWELDPTEVASSERRQACRVGGRQPVITFDGGSGEDIVAEPVLEDPNRPWIDPTVSN